MPVAVQTTHDVTVLVIDNERSIARIVQRVLGHHHTVKACETGEEAAALILGGERFDVILCDMLMPEMSGEGFYDRLARIAPELVPRLTPSSTGFSAATWISASGMCAGCCSAC